MEYQCCFLRFRFCTTITMLEIKGYLLSVALLRCYGNEAVISG